MNFSARAIFLGTLLALSCVCVQAKDRLVIEFKDNMKLSPLEQSSRVKTKVLELERVHRQKFTIKRNFGESGVIVELDEKTDTRSVLQRLESDPTVQSVALDRRLRLFAQPRIETLIAQLSAERQMRTWLHQPNSIQAASINSIPTWANYHGSSSVVIAVLDTGVLRDHPMLQGHLLSGYDFVSDGYVGNDGQSSGATSDRDPDPTDPGDGVSNQDLIADPECGPVRSSSWHGTFTSALLAGNPNVLEGILPVNWNASILPVRVLGKCGGFTSDLADAIRWAAGLNVAGVPVNRTPARIINLSLGADGACVNVIEGAAIAAARAAGAIVVVAAGNDGSSVDTPANCTGAVAVASTDHNGLKADYSNFGSAVDLVAPGGDFEYPIWSASNAGVSGAAEHSYTARIGTSFSAPLVSGALSLLASLRPALTGPELEQRLLTSTRTFLNKPTEAFCAVNFNSSVCNCTSTLCGVGMLDVDRLIRLNAPFPLVNLFGNSGNALTANQPKEFSARGSVLANGQAALAANFSIRNVRKTDANALDPVLTQTGLDALIQAGVGVTGFDLLVTLGDGSSTQTAISNANVTTFSVPGANGATPPSVGNNSSGGGGGAFTLLGLGVLLGLMVCLKTISNKKMQDA